MTRSNWEVEDGAEPSLVNNSSSTFSLFWTIEHRVGRPADGPVRLGLAQVIPPPAKSLGLGLIRHAVRLTASKDDVRRGSHKSSVRDRINATINRADDLLRERLRREKAAGA